jgi:DMSO reductase anchor subunit
MGFSSLTKVDKFEKFAQVFYSASLLFAPAWWVGDNFVSKTAPSDNVVLCLARIMGILCSTIAAMSYLIRSDVTNKAVLTKADYLTAAAWGVCALVTVFHKVLYKNDKFIINAGLQITLAALYAHQSTTRGPKKAAKDAPVTRAKSPARSSSPAKSPAKSPARGKSPSRNRALAKLDIDMR